MMASHAPAYRATPLDALLAAIPSLPRPILARLTSRMIERMDELDGDSDNEPEEDRCEAGDDEMRSGVSPGYRWCAVTTRCGSDDDAEPWQVAAFDRDQPAKRTSLHVR